MLGASGHEFESHLSLQYSARVISAIVVSYRSAALARRALTSLSIEASSSGLSLETICVVNSGDPGEAKAVRDVASLVLTPSSNLGYGGGLNLGADHARGDVLVFSNPDVLYLPGSLRALIAPLASSRALMTGPAFFLDEGATLVIPPATLPTPMEFVRRALALTRPGSRLFRRDLRLMLAWVRAIREGAVTAARALVGAVMAVDRRTWKLVGPFDEGYRLYYEENDWQERLRALGGRLALAGAARVHHKYNQSARKEPRAVAWFAESESRFLKTYFGSRGEAAQALVAHSGDWSQPRPPGRERLEFPGLPAVGILLSPAPYFRPFVFTFASGGATTFALPPDVLEGIAGETWYGRAVDLESLRVLDECAFSAGPAALSVTRGT